MTATTTSRRQFLRSALALPIGLQALQWSTPSMASGSGDYKALVCVFLYGGNDAYNTVLATDSTSWGHYLAHRDPASRGQTSSTDGVIPIALMAAGTAADPQASDLRQRLGGVLPLPASQRAEHAGRSFALHPSLSQCASLYQAGRLAVVPNVGPLLSPTTKDDLANAAFSRPSKLYSHIDQFCTWQSFRTDGAGDGWGGRMADLLCPSGLDDASLQGWRTLACMSPATEALWLSGRDVHPYFSSPTASLTLDTQQALLADAQVRQAVRTLMTGADSEPHLLKRALRDAQRKGLASSDLISPLLPAQFQGPWGTPSAGSIWNDPLLQYSVLGQGGLNELAVQLQMVARLIEANRQANLGVNRQMFFVHLYGFDTHDQQTLAHAQRLAQLDHALAYFDQVLSAMPGGNLRNQVTTFTSSDFGRTFTSNGDGTDHGWGGHHLVMGGAVRGGEVYGRFPTYSTADNQGVFASPDQLANGSLLPAISVDQYAATLGSWMGLSDTQLLSILPNLRNFGSGVRNLGFMQA